MAPHESLKMTDLSFTLLHLSKWTAFTQMCIFIFCDNVWCKQSNYKQNLTFFSSRVLEEISNSEDLNINSNFLSFVSFLYRMQTLHDHQSEKNGCAFTKLTEHASRGARCHMWSVQRSLRELPSQRFACGFPIWTNSFPISLWGSEIPHPEQAEIERRGAAVDVVYWDILYHSEEL